jgi:hypothetical protein
MNESNNSSSVVRTRALLALSLLRTPCLIRAKLAIVGLLEEL